MFDNTMRSRGGGGDGPRPSRSATAHVVQVEDGGRSQGLFGFGGRRAPPPAPSPALTPSSSFSSNSSSSLSLNSMLAITAALTIVAHRIPRYLLLRRRISLFLKNLTPWRKPPPPQQPPPPPSQQPPFHLEITLLPDEVFYGVPSSTHISHSTPSIVSTKGRYISSSIPFTATKSNTQVLILQPTTTHLSKRDQFLDQLRTSAGHRSLRGAVRALKRDRNKAMQPRNIDPLLFTAPVYEVAPELGQQRTTQASVISYAEEAIQHNLPAGVLCIDADGWMDHRGSHTFHNGRFPNPETMISHLHALGFKVCLHVTPLVSPDSVAYDELSYLNALVPGKEDLTASPSRRRKNPQQALLYRHRGGLSALLDTTTTPGASWLRRRLASLRDLGVDGFAPDGGSPRMYHAFDGALPPYLRCRSYVDTVLEASGGGSQLCLAESSWGMVDHPLGVRLGIQGKKMWDGCGLQEEDSDSEDSSSSSSSSSSDDDRDFSSAGWRELHSIIQSALTLGMAGLPFTCPGPAGGLPKPPKTPRLGSAVQHKNNSDVDPELLVRQAQAMALLPMMRIGVAPWRQLDATYLRIVVEAARLRMRMGPSIVRLAHKAMKDGDPIVRPVEYHFPKVQGCDDCFLLGNVILVAPVLKRGCRSRVVKFPPGTWEGMDGVKRKGGEVVELKAGLGVLPWFCRLPNVPADSILLEEARQIGAEMMDERDSWLYSGDYGDNEAEEEVVESSGEDDVLGVLTPIVVSEGEEEEREEKEELVEEKKNTNNNNNNNNSSSVTAPPPTLVEFSSGEDER